MSEGRKRGEVLVARIYAAREDENKERRRSYLGASAVGGPCPRRTWLEFRWMFPREEHHGRMLRLFETGHLEEARFVKDLKRVGAQVFDTDPDTINSQISIRDYDGLFRGHLDAIALDVPESRHAQVVVEMKTHNEKSFKELVKKGVKDAKPQHYTQLQLYMEATEIKEGLYFAKNKNTDELYAEFLELDDKHLEDVHQTIRIGIFANTPPSKISQNPDFYLCKWCPANDVCHHGVTPPASCRSCIHSEPRNDNIWTCNKHGRELDYKSQIDGCPDYEARICEKD